MQIESVRTNGRADVLPGILFEMLEILESSSFSFRTYLPFGFAPLSSWDEATVAGNRKRCALDTAGLYHGRDPFAVCSPI